MNRESIEKVLISLNKNFYNNKSKPFIMSQCFFHWNHKGGDKNPSFSIKVSDEDYSWCQCYTCHKDFIKLKDAISLLNDRSNGRYTNVLSFVLENDNPNIEKKVLKTIENCNKIYKKSTSEDTPRWFDENQVDCFSPGYHPYAKERGITRESFKFWGIKFDQYRQRIVFPIRRESDSKLVGAIGRTIGSDMPKYLHYFGLPKNLHFYGENLFSKEVKKIVIVEGTIDVIKMWQLTNLDSSIIFLATLGTNLSQNQSMRLLQKNLPVYVMYDGDKAGQDAISSFRYYLKKHIPLSIINLPDNKDPSDIKDFSLFEELVREAEFVL